MDLTHDEANKRLNQVKKVSDERQQKFYTWIRTLITITVGLFGIIISFKSNDNISFLKSVMFILSISSLGLGILFAIIVLYTEVHLLDGEKDSLIQSLLERLDGKTKNFEINQIKPSFFYKVSYKLCVLFYLIALFSLIIYPIIDEIKNIC